MEPTVPEMDAPPATNPPAVKQINVKLLATEVSIAPTGIERCDPNGYARLCLESQLHLRVLKVPKFDFGVFTGILTAAAIASTAIQVAKIAATPVRFTKGGAINPVAGVPQTGQLHGNGGIRTIDGATGQHLGEWERGEPYMILSRNTYANNRETVDALLHSSLYRNGAPIVNRHYEDVGVVGMAAALTSSASPGEPSDDGAAPQMIGLLQNIDA